MSDSRVAICEIELYLPGVTSLKEKRGIVKSILQKMRNQFNVANAEVGRLDSWQSATIAVSAVSNSSAQLQTTMQNVMKWMESRFPDAPIVNHTLEIL